MSLFRIFALRSINKLDYVTASSRRLYSQTINLSDPAIQSYLKYLMLEHENLMTISKRTDEEINKLKELKPIIKVLEQRVTLFDNIDMLKQMIKRDEKDPEVKKMIAEEAQIYLTRIKDIDNELKTVLLEPNLSNGGVLLEVVAGAGGQEAMLFARELLNMYISYAEYKGWDVDIASIDKSDIGGYRKASLLIEGHGAPELMKIEAGVHRVQRIPTTEKGGRIHTSTVSVAILPQPSDIELDIPERDITVETKRASGAGGQHVNTTDSAVRVIHNPTGTAVECQEGRSQIKNKQIALQKLRTLLLQKQIEDQHSKINSERKAQMGLGNRNEKIRTYNFPQDRITEHRDGGCTIHNLKDFMAGGEKLENLQENLLNQQRYQILMDEIADFVKKFDINTQERN